MEELKSYDWPGNVRELHNFIERAMNISSGKMIYTEDLPEIISENDDKISEREDDNENKALKDIVAQAEKKAIIRAIKECDGNRTEAAKKLNIHRTSLYHKIDKYDIKLKDV